MESENERLRGLVKQYEGELNRVNRLLESQGSGGQRAPLQERSHSRDSK